MSWLQKAENILNQIDKSANTVLKSSTPGPTVNTVIKIEDPLPRVSSKNILVLKQGTPSKKSIDPDDKIQELMNNEADTSSDTQDTVINFYANFNNDDVMSNSATSQPKLRSSSSTVSLNASQSGYNGFNVEKELAATKIVLIELKSERDELRQEVDQLKSNNNQIKVIELEDLCNQLLEEKENLVKISQSLETSNQLYIKSISELESTISKHTHNENDFRQKLEYAKKETSTSLEELAQYRQRAQKTLQMKESIIEQLRSGQQETSRMTTEDSTIPLELEQLKQEREILLAEMQTLRERYENSKSCNDSLESKYRDMEIELLEKNRKLDETINQLGHKCSHYEEEIRLLKDESLQKADALNKHITKISVQLGEKEAEIVKYKQLNETRPQLNTGSDLENRIHNLTSSLISKQSCLENVTAERNAFKFEMEKLKLKHEETLVQVRLQRQQLININETDDTKSQIPNFFQENPFDNRVSRRVKRAYSSVDSVGIRLGVFLRRYPLARNLGIGYIFLLNFWVLLVLFTSTPGG